MCPVRLRSFYISIYSIINILKNKNIKFKCRAKYISFYNYDERH